MLSKKNMIPNKHLVFIKFGRALPDTIDDMAANWVITTSYIGCFR